MKKLAVILLSLILMLCFAACGEDPVTTGVQQTPSTPSVQPTTAPTEPHIHSFNSEVTEATCTSAGYTMYTCDCGTTYKDNYKDALSHSWQNTTCTTPKTCNICGATEGSAAGHVWKPATCTEPKTCAMCGVSEGNADPHIFIDNKCIVCGALNYSEGLSFKKIEGGYAVDGIGSCTDLTVIIPPTYNGLPVIQIAERSFANYTLMSEVYIPGSVTVIGTYAFYGCKGLVDVTISEGVKIIGEDAFQACSNLKRIAIPDSVTTIAPRAFAVCKNLVQVIFGENSQLISIEEGAFLFCESLARIDIPKSVTTIGDSAFFDCGKLHTVTFAEDSFLVSIGESAFWSCGVKEITIPDGVTKISNSAFSFASLSNVFIPKGITIIEADAFSFCWNLTTIRFGGTMEEWKAIIKGKDWIILGDGFYDSSVKEVICADGTVQLC